MTANRDKLQYARCMIEVKIDQEFPGEVKFKNERNEIVNVNISYEWKPETCKKCKKLGHDENQCYIREKTSKMKKIWQQKGLTHQDAGAGGNEETRIGKDVEVQQYKEGGQPPLKSQLEEPRNPRLTGVLAWNPNSFTVGLEQMTDQAIHCVIKPNGGLEEFFCTFICAHNDAKLREYLWETLSNLNRKIRGPWLLMGDFNCVMNIEERIGNAVRQREMDPMRRCISECEFQDIPYSGHFYTWSNKQATEDRVWSKLDRVMANEIWLEKFQSANAVFLTEGCSDHCPAILRMNFEVGKGRKPFKYFQMWQQAPDYYQRVQQAWEVEIRGTAMLRTQEPIRSW
ncbi:LINE-1 retrotransposable element ORF2 protein [Bienertia sinuspersici]